MLSWNSKEDNRRLFSNKLMERYCLQSCWVSFSFFFLLKFGIQFRTSSKTTSILLLKNGQISYRYNTCQESVICLTENMIVKMFFKSLNWKNQAACLLSDIKSISSYFQQISLWRLLTFLPVYKRFLSVLIHSRESLEDFLSLKDNDRLNVFI